MSKFKLVKAYGTHDKKERIPKEEDIIASLFATNLQYSFVSKHSRDLIADNTTIYDCMNRPKDNLKAYIKWVEVEDKDEN